MISDAVLIVETERLRICQFRQDDFEALYDIMKKPEVMYAWENGFSEAETQEWLDRQMFRYRADGFGYFAVIRKDSGRLIGQVGLMRSEVSGEPCVEIGYIFDNTVWKNGYAFEAADACVDLAVSRFRLARLFATIRPENASSVRLAVKLGMKKVGAYDKVYKGKTMRHDIYSLDLSDSPNKADPHTEQNEPARQAVKLVSFDLDDTLIRDVHSVLLPCILNGKEKECLAIDRQEKTGELDYVSADYLKARLFEGLQVSKIADSFLEIAKPLDHIQRVVDTLHNYGIKCIIITVGPRQVAKVVCDIYGFDECYGSDYEEDNGLFTGRILQYLNADSKVTCLMDYCNRNGISPAESVAVGDGATDIPSFEYCGSSIALNAAENVKQRAKYILDSQDLSCILQYIVGDRR